MEVNRMTQHVAWCELIAAASDKWKFSWLSWVFHCSHSKSSNRTSTMFDNWAEKRTIFYIWHVVWLYFLQKPVVQLGSLISLGSVVVAQHWHVTCQHALCETCTVHCVYRIRYKYVNIIIICKWMQTIAVCIWQSTKHLFQLYIGCKHTVIIQVWKRLWCLCYQCFKLKRWRCKQILIKVKSESEKEKRLEEINNAWAQQNQSHEPKQPTNAPNLKLSWRRKEGDIYEGAQNHKKKKKDH